MVASTLQAPTRGWFDVLDDWLKIDRFVFIGWSGLLHLPCASGPHRNSKLCPIASPGVDTAAVKKLHPSRYELATPCVYQLVTKVVPTNQPPIER